MSHDLLASIADRTVTAEQLVQHATAEAHTALAMGAVLNAQCITDADLPSVYAALDWWPVDAPVYLKQHGLLPLVQQCVTHLPGQQPLSVMQVLTLQSAKVVEWLQAEGRSVVNPNESAKERKDRLNREAQQRHRERYAKSTDPVLANAAQEAADLYKAYQGACAARRASDEEHKGRVAHAWADYQRAKEALDGVRAATKAAGL